VKEADSLQEDAVEAPAPATGTCDTRGDWNRVPKTTGRCRGWQRLSVGARQVRRKGQQPGPEEVTWHGPALTPR